MQIKKMEPTKPDNCSSSPIQNIEPEQNILVQKAPAFNGSSLIMLIAEDNADMRAFIKERFQSDFKIIDSENGNIALSKALQIVPDIIISDIMMPEMDGFELCRKLKTNEKTSHIPVILLTALANQKNKLDGLELHADDYVVKPFDIHELFLRVNNLILAREAQRKHFKSSLETFENCGFTRWDETFLKKAGMIVNDFMEEKEFGVAQLATKLGWSRESLYRKIKALTNLTAEQYIYDIRLQRAETLLRKTDKRITEIYLETGFSSPSHLARHFRKKYGSSPREYRKNF